MGDLIIAAVWLGDGSRCNAVSPEGPIQCDLITGHFGPHFYVLDHDDEGGPRLIGTFTKAATAARGGTDG